MLAVFVPDFLPVLERTPDKPVFLVDDGTRFGAQRLPRAASSFFVVRFVIITTTFWSFVKDLVIDVVGAFIFAFRS